MAWREIKEMIAKGAKVTTDATAKAAYLVLGNQWVSFDTPETLRWKIQEAKKWGLGGSMVSAAP